MTCESLRRSTYNFHRSLRCVWSSWSWKTSARLTTSSRLGADPAGSGRRNTFSVSMFWNVTQGNYVFTLFKGVLRGKWCAMFVCVCLFFFAVSVFYSIFENGISVSNSGFSGGLELRCFLRRSPLLSIWKFTKPIWLYISKFDVKEIVW